MILMLIFIDDSGDPEFKLSKGSSTHFVIACVIFDDNLDAEETALKIKRLSRSLNWHENHEFKFSKASKQVRLQFLDEIKECNFKFVDSKTDNLIQLADMIAGSTLRSRQVDKTDSEIYTRVIASRVEDIWDFQ